MSIHKIWVKFCFKINISLPLKFRPSIPYFIYTMTQFWISNVNKQMHKQEIPIRLCFIYKYAECLVVLFSKINSTIEVFLCEKEA
jgi:hypothetical protein